MAAINPTVAGRIEVVEHGEQETAVAAADLSAGTGVRKDANGKWIQALATSAANAKGTRVALRTVKTGEALTAQKTGVVGGFTIAAAYDGDVFLNDTGVLGDAAGTAAVVLGRVLPGTANQAGAAHDKNIRLDCPL